MRPCGKQKGNFTMTHYGKIKSYDSGKGAGMITPDKGGRCPAVQQVRPAAAGTGAQRRPAFSAMTPGRSMAARRMPSNLQMEQGSG